MFEHAAFRPFWPVIFLLPWVLVGIGYLVESLLQRRPGMIRIYPVRRVRSANPGGGTYRGR
jgi:hypothetical protein